MSSNRDLKIRLYMRGVCRRYNLPFVKVYLPTLQKYRNRYVWPDDYFFLVDALTLHRDISFSEYRKICNDIKNLIEEGHTKYKK